MRLRRAHIFLAGVLLLITAQAAAAAPTLLTPQPELLSVSGVIVETTIPRSSLPVRTLTITGFIQPAVTPTPKPSPKPTPRPVLLSVRLPKLSLPGWQWPIRGPITTWFSGLHLAIDIAAPCGTPLVAAHAGTVVWAGWKTNGGGNVVDIAFPGGLVSNNHLSKVLVSVGQLVSRGQRIGLVGETGWATGCHVHFAVMIGLYWIDPMRVLP